MTLSVTGRCLREGGDISIVSPQHSKRWSILLTFRKKLCVICELGPAGFLRTVAPEYGQAPSDLQGHIVLSDRFWENSALVWAEVNCRSGYNSLLISGLSYKTAFNNELLTSIFPL
jgi:hypothetical protein